VTGAHNPLLRILCASKRADLRIDCQRHDLLLDLTQRVPGADGLEDAVREGLNVEEVHAVVRAVHVVPVRLIGAETDVAACSVEGEVRILPLFDDRLTRDTATFGKNAADGDGNRKDRVEDVLIVTIVITDLATVAGRLRAIVPQPQQFPRRGAETLG